MSRILSLDKLSLGQGGEIVKVAIPRPLSYRYAEMGFCRESCVKVLRRAPLGDPVEVFLNGYSVCIRKDIAKYITVKIK